MCAYTKKSIRCITPQMLKLMKLQDVECLSDRNNKIPRENIIHRCHLLVDVCISLMDINLSESIPTVLPFMERLPFMY